MTGPSVAIVVAAGSGKRFGGPPKQFLNLGGKPMLIWSLALFEAMPEISEIIPVVREEDLLLCADLFEEHGISKVRMIAPGGRERQDSVFSGLQRVSPEVTTVLIHDAARPLIVAQDVRRGLAGLQGGDGVVLAVPVKDTLKEAADGIVKRTLVRDELWAAQTPQIFPRGPLVRAYECAYADSFTATDDAAIYERFAGSVRIVEGSHTNIKITTPEDLMLAEVILSQRPVR